MKAKAVVLKNWILKPLVLLLVVLFAMQYIGEVMFPDFKAYRAWRTLPDNTVDLAFVGSSQIHFELMPQLAFDEYGVSAMNVSSPSQNIEGSYWMLKEFLRHQSPQVVVIGNLYSAGEDSYSFPVRELPMTGVAKYQALYEMEFALDTQLRGAEYYFRFLTARQQYDMLTRQQFAYYAGEDDFAANKGYIHSFAVFDSTEHHEEALSAESIEDIHTEYANVVPYLDRIRSLAETHGFTLVIYNPAYPENHFWSYKDELIQEYASEHGVLYIDCNVPEVGIDPALDYRDTTHTNIYGSLKVTRYLMDWLVEQASFADRRGDEGYSNWNKNAGNYNEKTAIQAMDSAQSAEEYFGLLAQLGSRYAVGVYSAGNYEQPPSKEVLQALESLGFNTGEAGALLNHSFAGLSAGGQAVQEGGGEQHAAALAHRYRDSSFVFQDGTLVVDTQTITFGDNGFYFVVYDTVEGSLHTRMVRHDTGGLA